MEINKVVDGMNFREEAEAMPPRADSIAAFLDNIS
jgi:hypothetical protein